MSNRVYDYESQQHTRGWLKQLSASPDARLLYLTMLHLASPEGRVAITVPELVDMTSIRHHDITGSALNSAKSCGLISQAHIGPISDGKGGYQMHLSAQLVSPEQIAKRATK